MGALAFVLAVLSALVQWWPIEQTEADGRPFNNRPATHIETQDIQPTRQSKERMPPPPAPLPPVVVPNEVLVEQEVDIGEGSLQLETSGEDRTLQEGTEHAAASRTPDVEARLLRNVQPEYPSSARSNNVRARVEVEVQIGRNGRVEDATVRRRWVLTKSGSSRPVARLGHGLEGAALRAARRSLFQPARSGGAPVRSQTVITFTFGPE